MRPGGGEGRGNLFYLEADERPVLGVGFGGVEADMFWNRQIGDVDHSRSTIHNALVGWRF